MGRSAAFVLLLGLAVPALGREPLRLGGAELRASGEASGSLAPEDLGYFNELEYEQNALRLARVRLSTEASFGGRVAVLGEVRHANVAWPRVYALYLRLKPWRDGPLDVQIGRIPPVFGAYPRRSYAADTPLVGEPLGYQYLTSLRADAAPATT